MTYQDDLVARLHGGIPTNSPNTGITGGLQTQGQRAPGYMPSADPTPAPMPVAAPVGREADPNYGREVGPKQNASDPRAFIQSVLSGAQYGPQGLLGAEKQFTDAGYRLQKDSGGLARGRIYDPSGRQWDVFDPAEGRTSQDNWNTNMKGKGWSVNDMGMPSAGGNAPSTGNFQSSLAGLLGGDPMTGIQAALNQYAGQGDYLQQILAQLGQ